MRRGNDSGWLLGDDGKTIGMNLGADFTAEHEWGIKKIRQSFGLTPDDNRDVVGIDRRTITKLPGEYKDWGGEIKHPLLFKMNKARPPRALLVFADHGSDWYIEGIMGDKKLHNNELWLPRPDDKWNKDRECNIATAWSEGDFGIHVRGKDYCDRLKEIWDAFQRMDISIWIGGGHVFENGGLIVAIRSRCPQEGLTQMLEADKDSFAREKAAKDTGIFEILSKAGKRFYALSPRRWNDKKPGEPLFWLNPQEQQKYDSGWFTVDDLKLWAEDKGPVMRAPKSAETK